jgi:hypothetical protein
MYGVASFILFILWFFNPEQHYILWASAVFGVIDVGWTAVMRKWKVGK